MSEGVAGRRIVYYVLMVVGAIAVHQSLVADLLGGEVADFLRRNSEAYALAVLVPLYWDVFGWSAWPASSHAPARRSPGWWRDSRWLVWLGTLSMCVVLTQSSLLETLGIDLAQAVITLGEAFLGAAIISIYVAWSRAVPTWGMHGHGGPVESARHRAIYYAVAAGVSIAAYQSVVESLLGAGLVDWLILNVEALSAVLILPAYFDLVARPAAAPWVRLAWYPALLLVPLLTQTGVLDDVMPTAVVDWLGRSTEAFIAGIAVSFYFDVWRGNGRHAADDSLGGVMAEDIG